MAEIYAQYLALLTAQHQTIHLLSERLTTPAPGAQDAAAYVRAVAEELRVAGQTLLDTAEKINAAGWSPHLANVTHQAGKRALEQAEALARA